MNDGFIQVAPDGAGKKIDATERVVNSQLVERQRLVVGGNVGDGFLEPTVEGHMPVDLDDSAAIMTLLDRLVNRMDIDPVTGRVRVQVDSIAGAQTLATVTTVTTVTTLSNQSNIGGIAANSLVLDAMQSAWANSFLPCVSN
jgi:hypothetical protein